MSQAQLQKLLNEAEGLERSPTKVAVLEQAVLLADALGDVKQAYDVRQELITAATFSGCYERALPAFSWCLAQSDQDPQKFPDLFLLWRYKWMLAVITNFPQISVSQIHAMEDDYAERLKAKGWSLRPIHRLRSSNAAKLGELSLAEMFFAKYEREPRDLMADCKACEINAQVNYLVKFGKDQEAIQTAKPVLAGTEKCTTVPHTTLARLMLAWMRLADWERASEVFKRGFQIVKGQSEHLEAQAQYLQYLTRINEFAKAKKLVEEHVRWACETNTPNHRLIFYAHTANFFEKLASQKPRKIKLHLPSQLACYDAGGSYHPAALAAWFGQEAEMLAEKFNVRNGNRFVSEDLAAQRQLTLEVS